MGKNCEWISKHDRVKKGTDTHQLSRRAEKSGNNAQRIHSTKSLHTNNQSESKKVWVQWGRSKEKKIIIGNTNAAYSLMSIREPRPQYAYQGNFYDIIDL